VNSRKYFLVDVKENNINLRAEECSKMQSYNASPFSIALDFADKETSKRKYKFSHKKYYHN